jgi:integrase
MPRVVVSLDTPVHAIVVLSLKPDTLRDYRRSLSLFTAYLRSVSPHVLRSVEGVGVFAAFPSVGALDASFAAFLEYALSSRLSLSAARTAFSALRTFNPVLDRGLPVSHSCVTRLERLRPSVSPPPLTWPLVVLLSWRLAPLDARLSVAFLVAFDAYLRVSELLGLRVCDVVVPAPGADRRPSLLLPRTKTGRGRLQAVVVNRPEVGRLLLQVRAATERGGPTAKLFPFSAEVVRARMALVEDEFRLAHFTPHSFRHGGATADLQAGVPLDQVVLRGRWASLKSARRYLQTALAHSLAVGVLEPQHAWGRAIEPLLFDYLSRGQQQQQQQQLPSRR